MSRPDIVTETILLELVDKQEAEIERLLDIIARASYEVEEDSKAWDILEEGA